MPTERTNKATPLEWRALGFFYAQDGAGSVWSLVGSKSGLGQFAKLLREYAANPARAFFTEHDHYGPYMYLKVMTWHSAGIDEDNIHGSIADLERLALLIDNQLASAKEGNFEIVGELKGIEPIAVGRGVRDRSRIGRRDMKLKLPLLD